MTELFCCNGDYHESIDKVISLLQELRDANPDKQLLVSASGPGGYGYFGVYIDEREEAA